MSLTARQQRFVDEYLVDLNATQAAVRAGYAWEAESAGYYVYALVDSRNDQIFYVGKGKGCRSSAHVKESISGTAKNIGKSQRILDILACGASVHERTFMNCQNESQAFRVERALIKAWKSGLTNIAMGNVSQDENIAAQIERDILSLRTFGEWVDASSDKYLQRVSRLGGSPEAFYADFLDTMLRLLDRAKIAIAINTDPVTQ